MESNHPFADVDQSDLDVIFEEPTTTWGYLNYRKNLQEIMSRTHYRSPLYFLCETMAKNAAIKIIESYGNP